MSDLVKVRDLEWEAGIVDCATPFPGMKYVACSTSPPGSWSMWIDGVKFSHAVFPSEAAAKAAAQADYTARILAALDLTGVEALQAEVARLRAEMERIGQFASKKDSEASEMAEMLAPALMRVVDAEAETARLRALLDEAGRALKYYADATWTHGDIARATLAKIGDPT